MNERKMIKNEYYIHMKKLKSNFNINGYINFVL